MRKSVLAVSSLGILLVLADGVHARMFVVASDAPDANVATVDPARISEVRSQLPALAHRKM